MLAAIHRVQTPVAVASLLVLQAHLQVLVHALGDQMQHPIPRANPADLVAQLQENFAKYKVNLVHVVRVLSEQTQMLAAIHRVQTPVALASLQILERLPVLARSL